MSIILLGMINIIWHSNYMISHHPWEVNLLGTINTIWHINYTKSHPMGDKLTWDDKYNMVFQLHRCI